MARDCGGADWTAGTVCPTCHEVMTDEHYACEPDPQDAPDDDDFWCPCGEAKRECPTGGRCQKGEAKDEEGDMPSLGEPKRS